MMYNFPPADAEKFSNFSKTFPSEASVNSFSRDLNGLLTR